MRHDNRKVDIVVDKKNVEKKFQDGKRIFKVMLPEDRTLRGKDIGGYCIYPSYVLENTADESSYIVPFAIGIKLKIVKGNDSVSITAAELKILLEAENEK